MADEEKKQETYGDADVYFEHEVNLLNPKTPFMRDFLKLSLPLVIIYVVVLIAGPGIIFLTAETADGMGPLADITILSFPLHWFIVAFICPGVPFILAVIFAIQQDKLWEKYGESEASSGE